MNLTLLLSIVKNKYFLITVLCVVLILSGMGGYSLIYKSGYTAGANATNQSLVKAQDKAKENEKIQQESADKDRTTLNNQILGLKNDVAKAKQDAATKQASLEQEINNYAKNNKGSSDVCIPANDDGLRLINESFPN